MELHRLRYFLAVAEELHFGRAAERLHIVQSALSKQVSALERELEVELLDRSHGVALTPAGRTLRDEARVILLQADRAFALTKAVARGEIGSLSIGFIISAMWCVLPPVLREHRRLNPDLSFHLNELGSPQQLDLLRDGSLDVGFVRALALDPHLELEPIWREKIVVALADDHPAAANEVVDLAELKDEAFILQARSLGPPGLHEIFTSMCLDAGFTPRLEEANSTAGLSMVSMGLGVALVPESAQDTAFPGITFRPLTKATPELDLVMAYRPDSASSALRAFIETARRVVPTIKGHGTPATS